MRYFITIQQEKMCIPAFNVNTLNCPIIKKHKQEKTQKQQYDITDLPRSS